MRVCEQMGRWQSRSEEERVCISSPVEGAGPYSILYMLRNTHQSLLGTLRAAHPRENGAGGPPKSTPHIQTATFCAVHSVRMREGQF